jgi:hypothetical protein
MLVRQSRCHLSQPKIEDLGVTALSYENVSVQSDGGNEQVAVTANLDFAPLIHGFRFVHPNGAYKGLLCVGDLAVLVVKVTDPDGVASVKSWAGYMSPSGLSGSFGTTNMPLIAPNTYRKAAPWDIRHRGTWGFAVEAADPAGHTRKAQLSMSITQITRQEGNRVCGSYGEPTFTPRQ